jgi:ribose transport system substrate-binding protein
VSSPRPLYKRCLLGVTLLILVLASGCRDGLPTNSQPTPNSAEGVKVTHPTRTFGIIYPMAHPFYEVITQYAHEAAKLNNIELIVKAPDEANLEQQIRMMETMIKQKVDGIAIDSVDSDALVPVINKAIEAGIPVICFESDSPDSKRLSFIGTNNYQAGELMGEVVGKLLNRRGMILVETGMHKMNNLKERLDGMLNYLNEQTEIQVLEVHYNEGSEALAMSDMEAMIDAHPHFDAFVALDLISGSTSVLVWKAKGLNRYALTFGMMPEIKEAIHNGQITSAVSHNEHLWGQQIIDLLTQAADGKTIPAFSDTGTVEITAANLSDVPDLK